MPTKRLPPQKEIGHANEEKSGFEFLVRFKNAIKKARLQRIHRQVNVRARRNLELKLLINVLLVDRHQEIEDRRRHKKQSPNLKMRQAMDRICGHEDA